MDVETINEVIRTLSWTKLRAHLKANPLATVDEAAQLLMLVYHSDRMVRRRATDDGKRRDKFLNSFTEYLADCGYREVADTVAEVREEFSVIDAGYSAIFDVERRLPTANWSSVERVSAAMSLLRTTVEEIEQDMDRSIKKAKVLKPEPEVFDPEGNRYNPGGVFHNLAVAVGNIVMMEAYRANMFNDMEEVVLPPLPPIDQKDAGPIRGNFATANFWQLWKAIDEKTRFLGGKLTLVEGEPEWIERIQVPPGAQVKQALEFDANVDAEVYCVLATERFDERQRQSLLSLMTQTNLGELVAEEPKTAVPMPPAAFISFAEGHASEALYRALSIPLEKANLGDLTVAELLRGYALLHTIADHFYRTSQDLFPKITQDDLTQRFSRCGISVLAAQAFLKTATFRRSSRDLYDAPLIRCADGSLMIFGWTMLHPDLLKVVLSSMSRQEEDIEDKGSSFEKRIIALLVAQDFDAKNIKIQRGKDRATYDYDVVFTWDDYVFLFECKNRSLPGDSPIAVHYFNHSIESHVKQVQRLRKGLEEHPDILSERYPSAVGKKQLFCVVHGLPFARQPIDGICFSDESLIKRFFESPSLGFINTPLKKNTGIAPTRVELVRLWAGPKPTAEEFANYLMDPPQLRIAAAHYELGPRAEWLSETVVVKFNDLYRVGASPDQIAAKLKLNPVAQTNN